MQSLSKLDLLIATRNISLKITERGKVKIYDEKNRLLATVDLVALNILEIFSQPCSVAQAMVSIKSLSINRQSMATFLSTIKTLRKVGILQSPDEQRPFLSSQVGSYLSPSVHIHMLNDTNRTQSYVRAIHEVVRPGDVVVDVGTGTGVLAIAAAQAGAKRVYAIEATQIGLCAKELFKANGVGQIIELVQGWSTHVTLPEKANVFVSEMIGNKIFDENILTITSDAQKRLLQPDARLIPGKLTVYAVPLQVPSDYRNQYNFSSDMCANWQSYYGINFAPLLSIPRKKPLRVQISPQLARTWMTSLDAIQLGVIDFTQTMPAPYSYTIAVELKENIKFNALLIAFSAQLSNTELISTIPRLTQDSNHWTAPIMLYNEPIEGGRGESIELKYSLNEMDISCRVVTTTCSMA